MYSLLSLKTIGYILFASILLTSCEAKYTNTNQKIYFNLNQYLDNEINSLSKKSQILEKTISINNSSETKIINQIDFNKELEPFREGDINKSSWDGGFLIDSSKHTIKYKRISEKIPVKSLQIFKNLDNIVSIEIVIERDNILYHTIDTLKFYSGKGYEIRKYQKILLLPQKKYFINSYFK